MPNAHARSIPAPHGDARPVGVLVAQLGTPDAPTAKALRPYLGQFLSDMRVIDYSPIVWQPILRGVILNTRPKRSARLYARIWMDEGSPLLVYTQRQAAGVAERLGPAYRVKIGMRYGNPSIGAAMAAFEDEGIDRVVVVPMFPQFSSTTTASIYDAVYRAAAGRRCPWFHSRKRHIPTLRFVPPYFDDPGYIAAMCARLDDTIAGLAAPPDHVLISFHGIPNRYIRTGDPYRAQCEATAHRLAAAMGWSEGEWSLSFQSQFGPEKWLEPYTDEVLEGMAARGIERPLVFSPGFVADCLETLDELGNEGREQFAHGGGRAEQFTFAPCLNDHPAFLDALTGIVTREAMGWAAAPTPEPAMDVGLSAAQGLAPAYAPG